ncbi:hypothetical protein BJY52DRAFT_1221816 [Lactarius psammicola]|nr:hypothetical protein BJY52DRAFT_1221816 [Lactarius psammicola]
MWVNRLEKHSGVTRADVKGKYTQLSYLIELIIVNVRERLEGSRLQNLQSFPGPDKIVTIVPEKAHHFLTCHDETMKHRIPGDSRDRRLRRDAAMCWYSGVLHQREAVELRKVRVGQSWTSSQGSSYYYNHDAGQRLISILPPMTTEEDLLQEQYMGDRLSRQLHLGYPRVYQEEYQYRETSRGGKVTRAFSQKFGRSVQRGLKRLKRMIQK